MEIRSITLFDQPGEPVQEKILNRAELFADQSRLIFRDANLAVQTLRYATPPFSSFLAPENSAALFKYAADLEQVLGAIGFDYLALGPALPSSPISYRLIPELIQATERVFCSALMTGPRQEISLPAVRACGEIIHQLGPLDPNGFANLYFTALANVPAGTPFFPAAYHGGDRAHFAVAVEAADLAVDAFRAADSLAQAQTLLQEAISDAGQLIAKAAGELGAAGELVFSGIDFSLAPFPEVNKSLGEALETLGVPRLGDFGSTAAAALLVDSIDNAAFPRTGFSGLMLPVLEDAVLARRAAEGTLTLKDLLLFSTVCGTGLDTVPLPGDTTPEQLSAVLLDLTALAVRLDKPLTARLMPIPGKKAGEETNFEFPYFANSRVMDIQAAPLKGLLLAEEKLVISPKKSP